MDLLVHHRRRNLPLGFSGLRNQQFFFFFKQYRLPTFLLVAILLRRNANHVGLKTTVEIHYYSAPLLLLDAPCDLWILVPWPEIEPRPQKWKHGVLTTGPPGTSLLCLFNHWVTYTRSSFPSGLNPLNIIQWLRT